jgi:hypothetical protein
VEAELWWRRRRAWWWWRRSCGGGGRSGGVVVVEAETGVVEVRRTGWVENRRRWPLGTQSPRARAERQGTRNRLRADKCTDARSARLFSRLRAPCQQLRYS